MHVNIILLYTISFVDEFYDVFVILKMFNFNVIAIYNKKKNRAYMNNLLQKSLTYRYWKMLNEQCTKKFKRRSHCNMQYNVAVGYTNFPCPRRRSSAKR